MTDQPTSDGTGIGEALLTTLGQIDEALTDVRNQIGNLDVRMTAVETSRGDRTPVVEVALSATAQQRLAELIGEIGAAAVEAASSAVGAHAQTAADALREMVAGEINRLLDEAGIAAHLETSDDDASVATSAPLERPDERPDDEPPVAQPPIAQPPAQPPIAQPPAQPPTVGSPDEPSSAPAPGAAPTAQRTTSAGMQSALGVQGLKSTDAPQPPSTPLTTNGHPDSEQPLDLDDLDDPFLEALATAA